MSAPFHPQSVVAFQFQGHEHFFSKLNGFNQGFARLTPRKTLIKVNNAKKMAIGKSPVI
jgi:hypothetical protein